MGAAALVRNSAGSAKGRAITHNGAWGNYGPASPSNRRKAGWCRRRLTRRGLTTDRAAFDDAIQRAAEWVTGETRASLLLLGGVSSLLLLITCATVATALFIRQVARRRELSVRAALGANRSQLVRHALRRIAARRARIGRRDAALRRPAPCAPGDRSADRSARQRDRPERTGRHLRRRRDWRDRPAVGAGAGLARGPDRRVGDPRPRRRRVVIGSDEYALAIRTSRDRSGVAAALLVSAGLLLTSFWRLQNVDLGFDGERVLTVEMRLLDLRYREREALGRSRPM